ncbi:MAG: tyramine oxidase [Oligoflexia bacterium]|nr:tyramine oxidase [Oligoflexia bacterium]
MKSHPLLSFFLVCSLINTAWAVHPFDDLSSDEVVKAIQIVKDSGKFADGIRFPIVKRQEPLKADWLGGKAEKFRQANVVVFDYKKSLMSELTIDLTTSKILKIKDLPGLKPPVLIEEYDRARALVRANTSWQKSMHARGIKDLSNVFVDIWAPGLLSKSEKGTEKRLLRALSYYKGAGKNFYSRPIEGVVVTVDLSQEKVVSVWDVENPPAIEKLNELSSADSKVSVEPLKPLVTTLPKGSSIKISGQEIAWYRWKFRYNMDPLQGLQIYHVRYRETDTDRTLLYKIALSEMLVPYASPEKTWSFRNAFDVGEYGIGKTLHSLESGKDVPSHALLLDVVIPDDLGGKPSVFKGIAVYERDTGILWKHRNAENGEVDMRRGQELVMTFMTTIGNYDYGINYIFHMDGSIQVEALLTGILLAKGSSVQTNPCTKGCLPLVEKNILAPLHQHFFNFRIDFDIDGALGNSAAENNVVKLAKSKLNENGNAFEAHNTILKTEKSAVRDLSPATARKWKVLNYNSRNKIRHPRGYAIVPGESAVPYLDPSNQIRLRARFIEHPMWFTVYKDDETSGAALYPTTAPAGEGLPKYIANNESLEEQDVVMWYTFGVTHVPRPEEWPIMNVHKTGFTLKPMNFFDENPLMAQ